MGAVQSRDKTDSVQADTKKKKVAGAKKKRTKTLKLRELLHRELTMEQEHKLGAPRPASASASALN